MREWSDKTADTSLGLYVEAAFLAVLQILVLIAAAMMLLSPQPVEAHPGGLAADGCHNDRKNGGRHCHRAAKAQQPSKASRSGDVYYPNCAAARGAGAAPIRRGEPGYASHLDRDNDGIACE
jgi:predicted lipid-binding transport protein (Tim44 family)